MYFSHVTRLRIRDFRGIQGDQVFSFEPGLNLITGQNGSGKSSILDAMTGVFPAEYVKRGSPDFSHGVSPGRHAHLELSLNAYDRELMLTATIKGCEVLARRLYRRDGPHHILLEENVDEKTAGRMGIVPLAFRGGGYQIESPRVINRPSMYRIRMEQEMMNRWLCDFDMRISEVRLNNSGTIAAARIHDRMQKYRGMASGTKKLLAAISILAQAAVIVQSEGTAPLLLIDNLSYLFDPISLMKLQLMIHREALANGIQVLMVSEIYRDIGCNVIETDPYPTRRYVPS